MSPFFFSKRTLIIYGENNVKEIMYRVLYVIAIYIMDIGILRLAVSLNICLENYAMHTERINGGK